MSHTVRIALDAMGGDHGPAVVVAGADLALARHPDSEFLFFGNTSVVAPLIAARPALKAVSRLVHTEIAVRMEDKPSQALRYGRRKSSMWLAIECSQKAGSRHGRIGGQYRRADGDVEIRAQDAARDRRAPPSRRCGRPCAANSIVLDVGASIGADAEHLVDLAVDGRGHGAHPVRH